jgi:hypothetical protein
VPKLTYSNVGVRKFSGVNPRTPTQKGAAYNAAKGLTAASNAVVGGIGEGWEGRGGEGREGEGRGGEGRKFSPQLAHPIKHS